MKLVNVTPHALGICGENSLELEPSSYLIRLQMEYVDAGEIEGIKVEKVKIGEVKIYVG